MLLKNFPLNVNVPALQSLRVNASGNGIESYTPTSDLSADPFIAWVSVKDHKASGSKSRFQGSVSAGTLNQVVLTTSSDFEVGQGICIKGAGNQTGVALEGTAGGFVGSGLWHIATITSINTGTNTITFSPSAVRAVSSVANNVQHDDSKAFNDAIRALMDKGLGGGTVFVPAGFYRCNKEFSDEQTDGTNKVNAIIYPPYYDVSYPLQHLEIVGEWRTGTIWNPKAEYGTIICTEVSGVDNYSLGRVQPSLIASRGLTGSNPYTTGFSHVECIIRNCHIRIPDNAVITGINWANAINGSVINCSVETTLHASNIETAPTNASLGIYMPKVSNAARCRIQESHVVGVNTAIRFSEHTVFDDVFIYRVLIALWAEAGGYPNRGNLSIEHCKEYLRFTEQNVVDLTMDIERSQSGHWWSQGAGQKDISTFSPGFGNTDPDRAHGRIAYVISAENSNPYADDTVKISTDDTDANNLKLENIVFPNQVQEHGSGS